VKTVKLDESVPTRRAHGHRRAHGVSRAGLCSNNTSPYAVSNVVIRIRGVTDRGVTRTAHAVGSPGAGGRAGLPGDVYGLSLDTFTKHEPLIAGKLACAISRPQDQVVRLCDHDQFFITSSPDQTLTRCLWMVRRLICLRSASLHAAQRRRGHHGNPVTQQCGCVPDLRTGRATDVEISPPSAELKGKSAKRASGKAVKGLRGKSSPHGSR
jgi:hypothetical protein